MQTERTPVDPPVPHLPALPVSQQKTHNTLQLVAIAILLCWLARTLSPDVARQVSAAADLSSTRGLLALLCCWVLSVLWHESGHLLAALLAGFDIAGIAFGPVRASRIDGRWAVQLSGKSALSASISALPHRSAAFDALLWRRGVFTVIIGGPIATVVAAAASFALLRFASLTPLDSCFFAFAVELNAIIFILGLVPNRPDAPARNDASLFVALLQGGSEAHAILLFHLITQLRRQGFRPCFYPEHVVRAAARAHAPPEFRALFAQAVSEWALDRGRNEAAEAWDRHALENAQSCSVRTYNHALAQSACVDVLVRHDWQAAVDKCRDINFPSLTPDWFQHRSNAIALLSRRNILDGMGELQRAEFCFPSGVPYFDFQRHVIRWLRETAKVLSDFDVPLPATFPAAPSH